MTSSSEGLRFSLACLPAALLLAYLPACGSPIAQQVSCPAFSPNPASPSTSVDVSITAVRSAARQRLGEIVSVKGSFSAASLFASACAPVQGSGVFDDATAEGTVGLAPASANGISGFAAGVTDYTVQFATSAIYVRLPHSRTRLLPAGRQWIQAQFDPANPNGKEYPEDTLSFFEQVLSLDPRLVLEELAGGVTAAGSGQPVRDGAAGTKRYAVTVDLGVAKQSLAGAYTGAFSRAITALLPSPPASPPTTSLIHERVAYLPPTTTSTNPWLAPPVIPPAAGTLPMEVVLDPHGGLASVTFQPPGSKLGTVTLSFSKPPVGADPDGSTVPGADKIVDVRWLLKGLGAEASSDNS